LTFLNNIFFEQAKMNYITTNIVIIAAQGVPKQSRKDQNPINITTKSVNAHTYKRARPPIMRTKIKDHITSFQPPQRA